ncbi:uncharacterized protein LOC120341651 [Styela clava]|uniref:ATPase inhibitor, mitochondrial-like n=1 Tax=Styela clava TaxID=7725 RepID=UPI00193A6D8D|nr:ATPase inhibitor, mitochondrial-like [Styela clava]
MASIVRAVVARRIVAAINPTIRTMSDDGAIRKAGGVLSDKEKAEENMYFRKLQQQQLKALKEHHDDEIENHEQEIKRLKSKIKNHKEKLDKLSKH